MTRTRWVAAWVGSAAALGMVVSRGAAQPNPGQPNIPPPAKAAVKSDKRAYRMLDEEVLKQVQPLWPEYHARLSDARERDPRDYRERMDRVGPVIERCEQLRKNKNPGLADLLWETFHLGEECRELARLYHSAPDEKTRTALAAQMREKLSQQVDLELKTRQFELAEFKKKIDKMQKELAEQADRRDKLVNERLQRWTGKPGSKPAGAPPQVAMPPKNPAE